MIIFREKYLAISLAFSGLISISPFFTYNHFGFYYISCLLMVMFFFLCKGLPLVARNDLIVSVILLIYIIFNYNYNIEQAKLSEFFILTIPFSIIFLLSGRTIRKLTTIYFVKIICFVLLISLFFSFLLMLGFQSLIPSYSFNAGDGLFTVYMFTVVRQGLEWNINGGLFHRFHSIFMEPGFVGTIAAFIVCAYKFNLKNKYCLIAFISGAISTSFAFYVIVSLYLIIKHPLKGGIFLFLIINLLIYLNHPFINQLILDRFLNGGSQLDTRTSIYELGQINVFYDWLFNGNIVDLIFGLGSEIPGSTGSYRYFLLSYGFLGVIVFSLLYFYLYFFDKVRIQGFIIYDFIFIFLFVLSVYQRPYIDNYYMLLVFSTFIFSNEILKKSFKNEI
ncbi:hypothetical protein C0W93_11585 [Photobacterium leiognathi subsp. mandapamensis]|uniref:Polysaccharide polymerase n=1 Tax=Photobacterium leiognathi subsp. mandapamensis TaxID=48408 RepID=A0A2T3KUX8_PHOLD|nr:hypothetical protein [Photobacterium leiognathi]PSV10643.1 hypothetical protein C0W93_11585 [Photobacterium leiognathi subsp. mandapamensis]